LGVGVRLTAHCIGLARRTAAYSAGTGSTSSLSSCSRYLSSTHTPGLRVISTAPYAQRPSAKNSLDGCSTCLSAYLTWALTKRWVGCTVHSCRFSLPFSSTTPASTRRREFCLFMKCKSRTQAVIWRDNFDEL